jgi:hypothetical protein
MAGSLLLLFEAAASIDSMGYEMLYVILCYLTSWMDRVSDVLSLTSVQ